MRSPGLRLCLVEMWWMISAGFQIIFFVPVSCFLTPFTVSDKTVESDHHQRLDGFWSAAMSTNPPTGADSSKPLESSHGRLCDE